jgi:hypothetical protein
VVCDFSAHGYRLPTEAEWEYAARGGNVAIQSYTYTGANALDEVGWYRANGAMRKHLVGQKRLNMLGLYDMSGNVWEWYWDRYGDYPSGTDHMDNPQGSSSGSAGSRAAPTATPKNTRPSPPAMRHILRIPGNTWASGWPVVWNKPKLGLLPCELIWRADGPPKIPRNFAQTIPGFRQGALRFLITTASQGL